MHRYLWYLSPFLVPTIAIHEMFDKLQIW
jgi:hypothetical protein